MAKPGDLPVHATDTNYPADAAPEAGTATKVEPTSGKQALGHRPGEKPPAQSLNWWQNLVYLWLVYVDSNTIDGDLHVEGALEVDDESTLTGGIANDVELTLGFNSPTNVEATEFCHSVAQIHPIAVAMTLDPNTTHTRSGGGNHWILASSTNPIIYPFSIPVGSRVVNWELYLNKASSAAQTHTAQVYRFSAQGAETGVGVADTNALNAPGYTFLVENTAFDIEDGYQYYIKLTPAAGGAGDLARHAGIYYTRPR